VSRGIGTAARTCAFVASAGQALESDAAGPLRSAAAQGLPGFVVRFLDDRVGDRRDVEGRAIVLEAEETEAGCRHQADPQARLACAQKEEQGEAEAVALPGLQDVDDAARRRVRRHARSAEERGPQSTSPGARIPTAARGLGELRCQRIEPSPGRLDIEPRVEVRGHLQRLGGEINVLVRQVADTLPKERPLADPRAVAQLDLHQLTVAAQHAEAATLGYPVDHLGARHQRRAVVDDLDRLQALEGQRRRVAAGLGRGLLRRRLDLRGVRDGGRLGDWRRVDPRGMRRLRGFGKRQLRDGRRRYERRSFARRFPLRGSRARGDQARQADRKKQQTTQDEGYIATGPRNPLRTLASAVPALGCCNCRAVHALVRSCPRGPVELPLPPYIDLGKPSASSHETTGMSRVS